jgi:hypothetical protein
MVRRIDRERFIELLNEEFPEIAAQIDSISHGLLHLEIATVSRATQAAIDSQDKESVKRHFRFIDEIFRDAAPDVENAQSRPDEGSGSAPAQAPTGVGRTGGILGQAPR